MVPQKASSSMKGGESINTQLQRREYLLKTSQLTAKWVSQFKQLWNDSQLSKIQNESQEKVSQIEESAPAQRQFIHIPANADRESQMRGLQREFCDTAEMFLET